MLRALLSGCWATPKRRECCVGAGLSLFCLAVYYWTMCRGVYPGESALTSATALRFLPGSSLSGHPIGYLFARLLACLPFECVPLRLNLVSVVSGAGAVYFLFVITVRLIYHLIVHNPYTFRRTRLEYSKQGELSELEHYLLTEKKNHYFAMMGALISTWFFAYSIPFWSVCTRLQLQSFHMLILLLAIRCSMNVLVEDNPKYILPAGFLWGIGVIEHVSFALLCPVILAGFLVATQQHTVTERYYYVCSFLVYFFLGSVTGVGLLLFWGMGFSWSSTEIETIIRAFGKGHLGDFLTLGYFVNGWILMMIQWFVPLYAAYAIIRNTRYVDLDRDDDSESALFDLSRPLSLGMQALVLPIIFLGALNMGWSPWRFAQDTNHIPLIPQLGLSITFGFVTVYLLIISQQTQALKPSQHIPLQTRVIYAGERIFLSAIFILAIITPFRNLKEADGRAGVFIDSFCNEVLSSLPKGTRCLVTDGLLDYNLLVQARLAKMKLLFVNENFQFKSNIRVASQKEGNKLESNKYDCAGFVRSWLVTHPDQCDQVASVASSDVWEGTGIYAYPRTVVYLGRASNERPSIDEQLQVNREVWLKLDALKRQQQFIPRKLTPYFIWVERHLSRCANDFGVYCLDTGFKAEAIESFQHSLTLCPGNISASINTFAVSLIDRRTSLIDAKSIQQRISELNPLGASLPSLPDALQVFGRLQYPAVANLVYHCLRLRVIQANSPDAEPPVLAQLVDYCRAALPVKPMLSRKPLPVSREASETLLIPIVRAIMDGDLDGAETHARAMLRNYPSTMQAWVLLAEILMHKGKLDEVEATIIPMMKDTCRPGDLPLVDMTLGALYLRSKPPRLQEAHEAFLRAYDQDHELSEAQTQFLQTSLLLADPLQIEEDCRRVLRHVPTQSAANAILGSIFLSQSKFAQAEKHLRVSISESPRAAALNDLAETLRLLKRLPEAEAMAHFALFFDPRCHLAWNTCAVILEDTGRLEEASAAHQAALKLCQTDIRLLLSAGSLEKKRGDLNRLDTLLRKGEPLLLSATELQKKAYRDLKSP